MVLATKCAPQHSYRHRLRSIGHAAVHLCFVAHHFD